MFLIVIAFHDFGFRPELRTGPLKRSNCGAWAADGESFRPQLRTAPLKRQILLHCHDSPRMFPSSTEDGSTVNWLRSRRSKAISPPEADCLRNFTLPGRLPPPDIHPQGDHPTRLRRWPAQDSQNPDPKSQGSADIHSLRAPPETRLPRGSPPRFSG